MFLFTDGENLADFETYDFTPSENELFDYQHCVHTRGNFDAKGRMLSLDDHCLIRLNPAGSGWYVTAFNILYHEQ